MRGRLISAAAVMGLAAASSAMAADLPVKAPVYKAPVAAPAPLWTGFYIGGNVGYSWGKWDTSSNQEIYNFESTTASPSVNGVLGGFQLGYNWQIDPTWVVGLEADIQVTGEKKSESWIDPGSPPSQQQIDDFVPRPGNTEYLSSEWKFPWFGTARVRGGFLAAPNWLIYATGGLAYGESKYSFNFYQPGAVLNNPPPATARNTTYALSDSSTRVGFAVGAGTEVKLDQNWSIKFEYLYVDLGTVNINTLDIDNQPFSVSYKVRDHIFRVGANYKF